MEALFRIAIFVLVVFGLIFACWRWSAGDKRRPVYPRGPRKYVTDTYREQNSVAKLLSDVLALKDRSAQWPEILKLLNPQDEPHIRTLLLELRGPHIFAPHTALNIIESICLSAKQTKDGVSRIALLEAAKSSMERITNYGN